MPFSRSLAMPGTGYRIYIFLRQDDFKSHHPSGASSDIALSGLGAMMLSMSPESYCLASIPTSLLKLSLETNDPRK